MNNLFPSRNLCSDHIVFLLQRCLKSKALRPGKQVHAIMLTTGIGNKTRFLNSILVGVYAGSGDLRMARLVFESTQNPNVFALNWMISASVFNGFYDDAIGYFSLMRELKILANEFSYFLVLKACVGLMDVGKGKEVHGALNRMGFETDVLAGNALIDMYCKCGKVNHARRVFDGMVNLDVPAWTSMICGYINIGELEQSLVLFKRMELEGLKPNTFTWSAMISGYARSGDCNGALVLFSKMTKEGLVPELVTWNAIISGFAQSHQTLEAVKLFRDMLIAGIKPNHVTVTGLLPVFGLMGSIQKGKKIHGLIYRMELDVNVFVATALVDMYTKCASVKDAQNVFDHTPVKNVATWNAMIGCYGKHGLVDSSIQLFEKMQKEGMQANQVTLVCVLSACSHGGLVEKGLDMFWSMKESYGIEPSKEHYGCVVDLLCRSGRIIEAYKFVKELPIKITDSIFGAFVNGCKIHGRSDLAKLMARDVLGMELKRPAGFVTLSNIYAADGEWEEVENVRNVMKENMIHKKPGFSWVEKSNGSIKLEVEKRSNIIETRAGIY